MSHKSFKGHLVLKRSGLEGGSLEAYDVWDLPNPNHQSGMRGTRGPLRGLGLEGGGGGAPRECGRF